MSENHGQVHLADLARVDDAARRGRANIRLAIHDISDIRHAVANGAACADDLLDQLMSRLEGIAKRLVVEV